MSISKSIIVVIQLNISINNVTVVHLLIGEDDLLTLVNFVVGDILYMSVVGRS